ncbi:MAG: hypothetical protein ABEI96_02800 [Haloarculaceae archaeon]
MTDDRSERLRKRRKRSARQTESRREADDADTSKPDEPSQLSERSETGGDDEDRDGEASGPVKESQTGTYMYLPESQTKELRRLYNVLKADYEFEYDTDFEKNRHFYPLVIQYGLDGLERMDVSEVKSKLDEMS